MGLPVRVEGGAALYVRPTISYRTEKWWVALTVTPQVWCKNYDGNPDNSTHLDLVNNEKLQVRLIIGFEL
jgi:hypothetical protein